MPSYDDGLSIKQSKTAFDMETNSSIPDLRNLKYACCTDHLNCPVCQQPFLQPMSTICGHTFCKECIEECLKTSSPSDSELRKGFCPLDRTPIDSQDLHELFPTPLIISNLVDDLMVHCLNFERGCEWKGHRWEAENHARHECGNTGVKCNGRRFSSLDEKRLHEHCDKPAGGETKNELKESETSICNLLIERRFADLGNGDCVHQIYDCPFCGSEITKITEGLHLEKECLLNFKTCDICQNDMIPFKSLDKHQENCKKSGRRLCPAHEIGCDWTGSNETSLEIHLENGNCALNKLQPYIKNLETRISEVSLENKYLQKQINHILDGIIQGKVTNLGYSEPLEEIGNFTKAMSRLQEQDRLLHLDYEIERLRCELDEKINPFIERESNNTSEQQTILNGLVSDNFMMKDEMNLQRALINSLRKQVQFFSFRNRQQQAADISLTSKMVELDEFTGSLLSRSSSQELLNLKL